MYGQAELRAAEIRITSAVCCDQMCRCLCRSLWSRRAESLQLEKQRALPSNFHHSMSAIMKLDSFVGELVVHRYLLSTFAVTMYLQVYQGMQ